MNPTVFGIRTLTDRQFLLQSTRRSTKRKKECNEKTARRDLADLEMKKVIVMEKSGATKLFQLNQIFSTYVDMGGLGSR